MKRWLAVRAPFIALVLLGVGCGGSGLAPVSGKLFYPSGEPAKELVGCSVVFEGTAKGKSVGSTGEVDADGRFTLTTNTPGDGAAIGPNKVGISPRWPGGSERADPLPILDKYASPATSELTVEVKPGKNELTLTVEAKPKRGKK